jgi:hypothetical protein
MTNYEVNVVLLVVVALVVIVIVVCSSGVGGGSSSRSNFSADNCILIWREKLVIITIIFMKMEILIISHTSTLNPTSFKTSGRSFGHTFYEFLFIISPRIALSRTHSSINSLIIS